MNLAALQHLVRSVRTLAQDHEMIVRSGEALVRAISTEPRC